MVKKKKISWVNVLIWVAIFVWLGLPILTAITLREQQRQINVLADLILRTNRNEKILDDKLNQLHDDQQNSFQFQIVPQNIQTN